MTNIDQHDILAKRGILAACESMNWQPHPLVTCEKKDGKSIKGQFVTHDHMPGWEYPIYSVAGKPHSETDLRWRSAGSEKPKFAWQRNGQPKSARYYFHPTLLEAVKAADGVCYGACGDMDMVTFLAAGKMNVLTWFGEEAVPKSLGQDLHKIGVKTFIMYPDCDEAGMRGAWEVWLLLSAVNISVRFYRLPYEMGSKKDTNNLWMDVEFNRMKFFSALKSCPEILPSELELYTRQFKKTIKVAPQAFYEETWQNYKAQVKKALGAPIAHNGGHDYWRCPLPSHTDQDPSFRISDDVVQGGWPTCSCGIQNDKDAWQQIGEALGLAWPEFLAHAKAESGYKQETIKPKPAEQKLPDEPEPPLYMPAIVKPLNIADRFETRSSALQRLSRQLGGEELIEHEPIEFPLKVLHRFGGFARLMRIGKMVYTLGASGSGKTSLLETIMELFLKQGYDIIVFSPEWNALDFASRSAHRHHDKDKTLTFQEMDLHLLRTYEAYHDIDEEKRLGRNGGDKVTPTRNLIQELAKWPGDAHFLKKRSGDTLEQLLDVTAALIETKRREGKRIPLVFWDYLERFPKNGKSSGTAWAEMVAEELKTRSSDWSVISWLFAQPRKSDAADSWEGEALQAGSARFLTEEQTNLYLTIGQKVDEFGTFIPNVGTINVVKNSLGAKSSSIDPNTKRPYGVIDVTTDFERLAWRDEVVITRKGNLNGYHGELDGE